MIIVLLKLRISIDIEIVDLVDDKDVVYGLHARYKRYMREQMNSLLKSLTTTCEGLGMLHYASNKSNFSSEE